MDEIMYHSLRNLTVMRLVCQHSKCHIITELRAEQVEELMKKTNGCCPVCGRPFTNPKVNGGADVITEVAKAIIALNHGLNEQVEVQFPVKQEKIIQKVEVIPNN
jgi:hypothetical protein